MKSLLSLLLVLAGSAAACGPFFPSSYLNHFDDFIENVNIPEELELIAREYDLIDHERYPSGWFTTAEAEQGDFHAKAMQLGGKEFQAAFETYATAIRAGDTNAVAPVVPEHLAEFVLYLEGTAEFKADPEVVRPRAWDELLALDFSNRLYRTVWVHYMLGNLAASHGDPEEASRHYAECRTAAEKTKNDYSLGLAHASFKRDYLAQTNLATRLERGVAAVGYYNQAWDGKRKLFCMEHLELDMRKAAKEGLDSPSMATLEAMALFNVGKDDFLATLDRIPELKITPRLAWFMYKKGEIAKTEAYLARCPEDDILANWLRFRLAQRAGRTDEAIACLKKWLNQLQRSDRVVYRFKHDGDVSSNSAAHGTLGALQASQGQMMDALVSFVAAGAYQDAALIAERYLETNELKNYVDTFEFRAPYHKLEEFNASGRTESWGASVQLRLSYLLARRLFREGRLEEARPYYPPEIVKILNAYLDARAKAANVWSGPNTRSAHLYHAARLTRWKGMELSGTELYPDYTIVNGGYPDYGLINKEAVTDKETTPAYEDTAPIPNIRFHYRHVAAEMAGEAAARAGNRNQKAMILWSAGSWIQKFHPKEADVYYKKLARVRFQSLAKTADEKRWFPEATPLMDYVHRNEEYVAPKTIIKAARDYGED